MQGLILSEQRRQRPIYPPRPQGEGVERALRAVTPAKAGVQKPLKILDSGLRQNDEIGCNAHLSTPSEGEGTYKEAAS